MKLLNAVQLLDVWINREHFILRQMLFLPPNSVKEMKGTQCTDANQWQSPIKPHLFFTYRLARQQTNAAVLSPYHSQTRTLDSDVNRYEDDVLTRNKSNPASDDRWTNTRVVRKPAQTRGQCRCPLSALQATVICRLPTTTLQPSHFIIFTSTTTITTTSSSSSKNNNLTMITTL